MCWNTRRFTPMRLERRSLLSSPMYLLPLTRRMLGGLLTKKRSWLNLCTRSICFA
uniref:Uncharacterized protein n=1 Tax=Arundo donax TaxID=35708 RepID=A0A0A9E7A7_ARUDO